jgi:hypothetical protein
MLSGESAVELGNELTNGFYLVEVISNTERFVLPVVKE